MNAFWKTLVKSMPNVKTQWAVIRACVSLVFSLMVNIALVFHLKKFDLFLLNVKVSFITDIDECKEEAVQCPGGNASMCMNTVGSYECRCKPGFNGNPVSLLGCIDINECQIPEFYCGPNADCENTQGGFNCLCFPGYEKREGSKTCQGC